MLCFDAPSKAANTASASDYLRCDGGSSDEARGEVTQRHLVTFAVDDGFMKLLTRAKEVSFRGKKEDLQLEKVFRKALEAYLAKNDPKEREARRAARRDAIRERKEKLKLSAETVAVEVATPESSAPETRTVVSGETNEEVADIRANRCCVPLECPIEDNRERDNDEGKPHHSQPLA